MNVQNQFNTCYSDHLDVAMFLFHSWQILNFCIKMDGELSVLFVLREMVIENGTQSMLFSSFKFFKAPKKKYYFFDVEIVMDCFSRIDQVKSFLNDVIELVHKTALSNDNLGK